MTLRQLQKRVDLWLERLRPLGLGHWTLHLEIVDEVDSDYYAGANASCTCSRHYDTMWIEFKREYLEEADLEEVDRTIIHELLHASMRDHDAQTDDVSQYLGEPHRSMWQTGITHTREGLVERLAATLNHAFSDDVVR